jgi:hypothetical protein
MSRPLLKASQLDRRLNELHAVVQMTDSDG